MKTTIRMSSYAHGLLMQFLCSSPRMLQLAGIINEHINLEVGNLLQASCILSIRHKGNSSPVGQVRQEEGQGACQGLRGWSNCEVEE
eukprot:1161545-Pelagomonas_calceolata.AAC.4